MRVTVRGADTGGVLAVIEEVLPPKAFITPHTHRNDVWVQVLEGEVGVLVADEVAHASAGQWALTPRDVPHAMWNASDVPARVMLRDSPWIPELARRFGP